jgi:hypothetical protein
LNNDIESWFSYFEKEIKEITFVREGRIKTVLLPEVQNFFYHTYSVKSVENRNSDQEKALKLWME